MEPAALLSEHVPQRSHTTAAGRRSSGSCTASRAAQPSERLAFVDLLGKSTLHQPLRASVRCWGSLLAAGLTPSILFQCALLLLPLRVSVQEDLLQWGRRCFDAAELSRTNCKQTRPGEVQERWRQRHVQQTTSLWICCLRCPGCFEGDGWWAVFRGTPSLVPQRLQARLEERRRPVSRVSGAQPCPQKCERLV